MAGGGVIRTLTMDGKRREIGGTGRGDHFHAGGGPWESQLLHKLQSNL